MYPLFIKHFIEERIIENIPSFHPFFIKKKDNQY